MIPESFFWKFESILSSYVPLKSMHAPIEHNFSCFPFKKDPKLTLSNDFVFFDDHKNTPHQGLTECFWTYWNKTPVCIVDNHQKVLPFIDEIAKNSGAGVSIIHIDAHRDDAIFPYSIAPTASAQEITHQCRVSDYLDAGKRMQNIKDIYSYTQSFEFDNFLIPDTPFVLNLDIDIYGEEGSMVPIEKKTQCILDSWYTASAICIATSPGFIDQQNAFRLIHMFLSH